MPEIILKAKFIGLVEDNIVRLMLNGKTIYLYCSNDLAAILKNVIPCGFNIIPGLLYNFYGYIKECNEDEPKIFGQIVLTDIAKGGE